MHRLLRALILIMTLSGARFPDAIDQRITLTGDAAISLAALLGLPTSEPASLRLPLGERDAWAVYLLRRDTEVELWNDNQGSPARYNTVEFLPGPIPALSISPHWLDLGTQRPVNRAGHYSFGSPFIPAGFEREDPWARIAQRLMQLPDSQRDAEPRAQRCVRSAERIEACVLLHAERAYRDNIQHSGYRVVVQVRRL